MTKHDTINYIADRLEEIHDAYPSPTDYNKRREARAALKQEVTAQGYTDATYTQMYNEATKIHSRRMGVKGNDGKP